MRIGGVAGRLPYHLMILALPSCGKLSTRAEIYTRTKPSRCHRDACGLHPSHMAYPQWRYRGVGRKATLGSRIRLQHGPQIYSRWDQPAKHLAYAVFLYALTPCLFELPGHVRQSPSVTSFQSPGRHLRTSAYFLCISSWCMAKMTAPLKLPPCDQFRATCFFFRGAVQHMDNSPPMSHQKN
jgi:hypothetical protein